jgi:hypothetical protein
VKAPTTEELRRAAALVAGRSDAEVVALVGNWRPLRPPPLVEFVRHCLIVDKETGQLIPFALWPAQEEALKLIGQAKHLVVPKGRQVGITWLELAAMLHAGTFSGMRLFPIARQSDEYAQEAITRLLILAGYDPAAEPGRLRLLGESPLPAAWRPTIVSRTRRQLRLTNGSVFRALTATRSIARGLAAYWGLADEYAFWPKPAEQLAAMESGCARLHVVSTGNGGDDAFAALYENAAAGRGAYRTLFIPSDADPRRDSEWYRLHVAESADPDSARREHARDVTDAFRSPEGVFFKRFSAERHVAEVEIVANWPTWRGIDFGYRHPACLWLQRSPGGQLFVVDELLPENVTTPEFVEAIRVREAGFKLAVSPIESFCDPAGRAANVQTAESEFEIFAQAGLAPQGRPSAVRDGCLHILNALAEEPLPLVVASHCTRLIRALAQIKPMKGHPEVYDTEHELYSHPLDALRYLLVNLPADYGEWTPPEPEVGPSSGLWGRTW